MPADQVTATVRVQRTIPASPARVYRAWLEPGQLRRWLAPPGYTVTSAEVDERVGGRHRIRQDTPEGVPAGGFDAELLELVPNERIVMRSRMLGPDAPDGPGFETLLTVTLREAPGGATELTLVHERLDALFEAMPGLASEFEHGWTVTLARLDEVARGPASAGHVAGSSTPSA